MTTNILKHTHAHMVSPTFRGLRDHNKCYPSSASALKKDPVWGEKAIGACLRAEWYRMTQTWVPIQRETYQSIRRMGYGNPLADYEIQRMADAGFIPKSTELQLFVPELRLSGRVDVIVWDPYGQEYIGIEQKTTSGYSARKTVHPEHGKLEPKPQHVLQTAVYAHCMREETDLFPAVKKWKIIYYDRDKCDATEHDLVMLDDGRISVNGQDYGIDWQNIENRFKELLRYVDEGEEPPRDFQAVYSPETLKWMSTNGLLSKTDRQKVESGRHLDKGDFECRFCKYREHCQRNGAPD